MSTGASAGTTSNGRGPAATSQAMPWARRYAQRVTRPTHSMSTHHAGADDQREEAPDVFALCLCESGPSSLRSSGPALRREVSPSDLALGREIDSSGSARGSVTRIALAL